jgi:YD repeat-containing protein
MKKILSALLFLLLIQPVSAQYYYKDLVTTVQSSQQFNLYRQRGVKKVTLTSYNESSTESAGFTVEQIIDGKSRKITTISRTTVVGDAFLMTTYNEAGQLISSTDSAQNAINNTNYTYDGGGRLTLISTTNSSDNITTTETHQYLYDEKGKPLSMLRIRNNSDTTRVQFIADEHDNVGEEKIIRSNLPASTVYYYYDIKNRLTDIVRYNAQAKRLLPDYMFEYNENDQLKKMVIIPEGTNQYQNWYYQYTGDGLKRMDLCYDKSQHLMGKVVYEYQH